jgi:hypothetical protein
MANIYWVGGFGFWDGTADPFVNWSTTSGGSPNSAGPTSSDVAIFDANSWVSPGINDNIFLGFNDVTIAGINTTGFLAGFQRFYAQKADIILAGSTFVWGSGVRFIDNNDEINSVVVTVNTTLTGGGIPNVRVDSGTLTLGAAAVTATSTPNNSKLLVQGGTLTTNGFSLTIGLVELASGTINLGASSLALKNFSRTGGTLNAGTSSITLSPASSSTFVLDGGSTFYNVTLASPCRLIGGNSFTNLTFSPPTVNSTRFFPTSGDSTVTGTLTCAGSSAVRRVALFSHVLGSVRTFTAASISATDCDFRDITIAGGAAGSSPTRAGNCGGNTGITFPAAKTVYRVGTNTTWYGSASWATTSGGTGADTNYPLPQDTAVINNSTTLTGTLSGAGAGAANTASINASARTTAITLSMTSSTFALYGGFVLGSGVTFTNTSGTLNFLGRNSATINPAGKTVNAVNITAIGGTVSLGGALTVTGTITLSNGTFAAGIYSTTAGSVSVSGTDARALSMGSGTWTLTGTGAVWNIASTTGLTYTQGTAGITLSNTSTSARTFAGAGLAYNTLTIGGATGISTLTFTGSNSFATLTTTKTVAHTLTFTGGTTTTVTNWSVTGTVGNVVTLNRAGSGQWTLTKSGGGTVALQFMNISNSAATPASTWSAISSTDGGGNTGWTITSPSNMFLMFA